TAEPHGRARHREEAALHLGDAEHRALTGDADVGSLEDFRPTRTREAFGGEDHGLGGPIGLEPGAVDDRQVVRQPLPPLVVGLAARELPDLREVHARARRVAPAGEDGDAQLVVAIELVPGVVETAHHLAVDGVALLGTVQSDDEDVSVLLDDDGGLGHAVTPVREKWRYVRRECRPGINQRSCGVMIESIPAEWTSTSTTPGCSCVTTSSPTLARSTIPCVGAPPSVGFPARTRTSSPTRR